MSYTDGNPAIVNVCVGSLDKSYGAVLLLPGTEIGIL